MLPCAYPPNEPPVYLCVSPKEAKRTEKTPGKLPGASHPFASGTTTLIWNHSSALWTVTAPPYFPAARRMDLIP